MSGKLGRKGEQQRFINIFKSRGALVAGGGHFVYKSGKHGAVYVNKDALYPYPEIHELCRCLAKSLPHGVAEECEVVVGPALGGIVLSRLMADYIWEYFETECLAVFAEKISGERFAFRRGYDKLIAGKRVLIVEDVVTTGSTVQAVRSAAIGCGAEVLGAAAIWNRGGITAGELGVPYLASLINAQFASWEADECPMCAKGIPVRTDLGHGQEFMIRKTMEQVAIAAQMAAEKVFGGENKK